MRRTSMILILLLSALASACGAPELPAKSAAPEPGAEPGAELRSVNPAAAGAAECAWPEGSEPQPPPACPEGCKWDGSKCKDERGVIVHQ